MGKDHANLLAWVADNFARYLKLIANHFTNHFELKIF